MCKGIGIDICEIARMEKILKDDRFLNRFFTPDEIAYIRGKGVSAAQTAAGHFAAREALAKALGTGIDFDLKEAEIRHDPSGCPYFSLSGCVAARVGKDRVLLSITHDGGVAAAVCIIDSSL